MVTKIALVGPTYTGKTTLARSLADHFHAVLVDDYMGEYMAMRSGAFTRQDLFAIAQGQSKLEDLGAIQAEDIMVLDSTLLKLKIWSEFKFGSCDPWILSEIERRRYDFYLLLDVDIKGIYNHPIEQPSMRDYFLSSFEGYLKSHELPYAKITDIEDDRLKNALGVLYNGEIV